MVEPLINNPGLWDNIHQGYTFHALDELGFSGTESVRMEIREHPQVLRDLKTVVEDFWAKYTEANPGAWNDPKYMVRGLSDVTKDNSTIVVRPLLVDYALIVFAGP